VHPGPAALPGRALPAMVVIVAPGADRVHSHRSQPEVTPERERIPSHFAPASPVVSLIPRPPATPAAHLNGAAPGPSDTHSGQLNPSH
jgi:hypothetical protein